MNNINPKNILWAGILIWLVSSLSCSGAEECPKNQARLNPGEPCIPHQLQIYLYCLNKSGGGKVEITTTVNDSKKRSSEIRINGQGSGIVLSGGANGEYNNTEVAQAAKKVSERLDSSLVANCKYFSQIGGRAHNNLRDSTKLGSSAYLRDDVKEKQQSTSNYGGLQLDQPIIIEELDFNFGKAELTERATNYLQNRGKLLSKNERAFIRLIPILPAAQVMRVGFEKDGALRNLMFQRQMAVRNELVKAGVNSDQIEFASLPIGMGGGEIRLSNAGERIEEGMRIEMYR